MNKLGIIVPYRNRLEHLKEFKTRMTRYLKKLGYLYEIIIVAQDDAKLFNRGMLLNIGFKYAEDLDCDYVVFHDVDMIPLDVDYSYSEHPVHLATDKDIFDTYFGGVTLFPMNDFKKINGYSNKYWGWGYEDDDLLLRCEKNNLKLDILEIKNQRGGGKIVKFNGVNSFIKCKNIFNLRKDTTIYISFYPDKLELDHTKDVDEFSVFSIPGYDFSISYTSFSRYNFCAFDYEKNVLYVNSNIKTNYKTSICIIIDAYAREIKVYQDGIHLGNIDLYKPLYSYTQEPYFYLGTGNPNRSGNEKHFKGYVDSFIIYSKTLSQNQIIELLESKYHNRPDSESILLQYDPQIIRGYKLVDLSGNDNDGEIVNCEISNEVIDDFKTISIPFKRKSVFKLLDHEENGFYENKWKSEATRWNQLRFINEVSNNDDLLYNDGLSDLKFVEYGRTTDNNVTQINVGI